MMIVDSISSGAANTRAPLAVMHVPKSAGHSTTHSFHAALSPRTPAGGFDRSLFGPFNEFDSFEPALRSMIYLTPGELPSNADLVIGHHARSTLSAAYPNHRKLTIIREPRCRLISNWLFWRSQTDEQLAPWGTWADRVKLSRASFRSFLTKNEIACHTDNLFTRMLLWPHNNIPNDDFIRCDHYDALAEDGMAALSTFDFVGLIEDPKLIVKMGHFLDANLSWPRVNETVAAPSELRPSLIHELDEYTLSLLHHRSSIDIVIWKHLARTAFTHVDPWLISERLFLTSIFKYIDRGLTGNGNNTNN